MFRVRLGFLCARVLVCALLTLVAIPAAFAQQSTDQGLAPSVAKALSKAKVKSVVVFDFVGPGDKLIQLGHDIAEALSKSLTSAEGKIHIVDTASTDALIKKHLFTPDMVGAPPIALWLARQLHADGLIIGKLSPVGDQLDITVELAKVHDGKEFAGFSLRVPLTSDLQNMLATSWAEDSETRFLNPNDPSYPQCLYCPRPDYSEEAKERKISGVVILAVQIGEDGTPKQIAVIQSEKYGLTEKAIEAVQKWKFKPASGPDGKPIATWTPVELTFRLY